MSAPKTLTERLEAIINALGATPVKGELIKLLRSVKLLEGGPATRKKEAKITTLQAENENLKIELQTVQAKIEQYKAEGKKQEDEKNRADITDIQFEILKRLPLVHEHGSNLNVIARGAAIPKDEAEIHLDALCKAKPALARRTTSWPQVNETTWRRTMAGNRYVVAKRLAGEEDAKGKKTYKNADLPAIQHEILLLIAAGQDEGGNENAITETLGKSLGLIRLNLKALEDANMASDPGLPDYGAGRTFYLRDTGAKYLAERDLL